VYAIDVNALTNPLAALLLLLLLLLLLNKLQKQIAAATTKRTRRRRSDIAAKRLLTSFSVSRNDYDARREVAILFTAVSNNKLFQHSSSKSKLRRLVALLPEDKRPSLRIF